MKSILLRLTSLAVVVVPALLVTREMVVQESASPTRPAASRTAAGEADLPAAAVSGADDQADARLGQQLVAEAALRLAQLPSVAASVRHRTRLFDQQLVGSGSYWQLRSPDGPWVRFDLTSPVGEKLTTVQHVSDGNVLWIRHDIEVPQLSRVDLRRVRKVARRRMVSAGRRLEQKLLTSSGLPGLLASLDENFQFSRPQPLTFQEVPVWAISGVWKPHVLTRLLPEMPGLIGEDGQVAPEKLPPQMPDRVFILLGRDDLFPYHIDYRRSRASSETTPRQATQSLVTLELFEVKIGTPVDPLLFQYTPGDVEIVDRTQHFVQELAARLGS